MGTDKVVYVFRDLSNGVTSSQEGTIEDIVRMYSWSLGKSSEVELRAVKKLRPFAFGVYAQLKGGPPLSKTPPVVTFWADKNSDKHIAQVTVNESWLSDNGKPIQPHDWNDDFESQKIKLRTEIKNF